MLSAIFWTLITISRNQACFHSSARLFRALRPQSHLVLKCDPYLETAITHVNVRCKCIVNGSASPHMKVFRLTLCIVHLNLRCKLNPYKASIPQQLPQSCHLCLQQYAPNTHYSVLSFTEASSLSNLSQNKNVFLDRVKKKKQVLHQRPDLICPGLFPGQFHSCLLRTY